MIPNFDIAKIRVRFNKTSPELNLSRLRELSRSLNRSSASSVVLEQSTGPQPYETIWNVFGDYGLIANERFNPSKYNQNTFPRNLRWIDLSQYDLNTLKGEDWGAAKVPDILPPFYMILGNTKYWPPKSNSGFMAGERDHDEILIDIVNIFFERRDILPSVKNSFFVGNMKELMDGRGKNLRSINLNEMLILDNVQELNDYPFMNLRPIAYYENDIKKIRFMREMMENLGRGEYAVQPRLKTYDSKHHNIRDHLAMFVSSIMPTFSNLYSNYPLDRLYPHVFKKGVE